MSFVAEPGKVTALVGPSGGGKSTVLALLLRFFDLSEGDILIDGQSISAVSRRSLRQQMAYVGQDVYLFRDTVRENIAFGKVGATEAEIVAAAKAACAHEFIMGFPIGLRHPGGRAWHPIVRRPASAHCRGPRPGEECADHPARRSDRRARFRKANSRCERRSNISARTAPPSSLPTACTPSCMPTPSWWWRAAQPSSAGWHDDLLRRGGRYASFFRLQHRDAGTPTLAPISATA